MSDILEIKHLLATRAQAVAEHLLPGGRKDGNEWRAGSVYGEKGNSLGVHLIGDKAGVWKDFATDEGGDLLDLWAAAKRMTLAEAIDQARSWLGLERPTLHRPAKREYTRPPKPQCRKPEARVRDYLVEDRNIPGDVLDRYKVGEAGDDIVFPFLLPDGTLALVKKRRAEDGAKPRPTAADCEPVLFGWQAVPDNAREILIAEGEIDALSWAAWDLVPATSVPFGGGGGNKQQWIENDFERLERFERIYIATDMDEQGDAAAEEIADRLGRHRCLRVVMPRKDGNACLMDGLTADDMARCLGEAKHLDPEGLRRPSDYGDNVVAMFWPVEGSHVGYRTPYEKLGDNLLFRPAEVTIWTGDTGAGKSQVLSDCAADWRRQGARMCLSSLEMKPAQTLRRMVKQVVGSDRPTEPAVRAALRWLDEGLLLYELVGKAKLDELLAIFDYARAKYGCDTFVVDSLMRLGIAGDDYTGQEQAMFRLTDWTIARNAHLHLVAHSKKGDRDRGSPSTGDIKGTMEIGANTFNTISIWRNRKLEDEIKAVEALARSGDAAAEGKLHDLMQKPGVILNVDKQRNGDFEGKVGLWFDQATYQYRSSQDRAEPRRYLPTGWSNAA